MPCCLQRNSQTRGREHRLWGAVTPTTLRSSARSVMGGIGPSMSLCRNALSRLTLDLEHFGTLQPTFGHLRPGRPARRIAGELCHLLTVGGVSQEFLGRIHWAFSWLRAGRAFIDARIAGKLARALSMIFHGARADLIRTPPVPQVVDPHLTPKWPRCSRNRGFSAQRGAD